MGAKELEALVAVIQDRLALGVDGHVLGTWTIRYDKARAAFTFNKCEDEVYCEERPSVIGLNHTVIDPGGPLLG